MSFLSRLQKQKSKLKDTETVVTNADGTRYVERGEETVNLPQNPYGFIVDTKPDDIPALIIDHLYIGSQDCTSAAVLEKYDIKCVISVGIEVPINVKDVTRKFVQCLDLPETDIKLTLRDCLPVINEAIDNKHNVLVHCNAGVSRTSMVAIGYLMQYKRLEFKEAYNLVKAIRPAIQPNAGFVKQLTSFKPGELIDAK